MTWPATWRLWLRQALRSAPQAAVELRALLDEARPYLPEPVHNTISGGVQSGTVIQSDTLSNLPIGAPAIPREVPNS